MRCCSVLEAIHSTAHYTLTSGCILGTFTLQLVRKVVCGNAHVGEYDDSAFMAGMALVASFKPLELDKEGLMT